MRGFLVHIIRTVCIVINLSFVESWLPRASNKTSRPLFRRSLLLLPRISSARMASFTEFESSLLACQRSAYLKSGQSKVLKCEHLPASNTYRVLLDNSVLYPEGGGQPSDQGTVNGIEVLKVSKPENSSDLLSLPTETQSTCVEVELPVALDPESTVECCVNWERRYDFMQQHTAQVCIFFCALIAPGSNGIVIITALVLGGRRQTLQGGHCGVGIRRRQRHCRLDLQPFAFSRTIAAYRGRNKCVHSTRAAGVVVCPRP